MRAERHEPSAEIRRSEAEGIAAAYLRAAKGHARAALLQAATDALTDLDAAGRRAAGQGRLIPQGYARGRMHG